MVCGVTIREQRLTFGEVADEYDDVRADNPSDLVDAHGGVVRHQIDTVLALARSV